MESANNEKAKCNHCGFIQSISEWISEADSEHDGKHINHPIGGDHARCPNCGKLVHIDYDLTEIIE
jgi:hypothetical protein